MIMEGRSSPRSNNFEKSHLDLNEEITEEEFEVPPLEDVPEMLERININSNRRKDYVSTVTEGKISKSKTSSSTAFGGMKKGFLFETKQVKKPQNKSKQKVKSEAEGIPFVKAQPANSSLLLKEVQEAMDKEDPLRTTGNNFTSEIESNPVVSRVLSDPAWLGILDEFQKDPEKAMIRYKDNKEVRGTMLKLCSILGDSFLHMVSPPKNEEEAVSKQLMEDPKLKEALLDPFIESVMECVRKGQNDRVHEFLRIASPSQKAKIQMLIDYGLFSYAS